MHKTINRFFNCAELFCTFLRNASNSFHFSKVASNSVEASVKLMKCNPCELADSNTLESKSTNVAPAKSRAPMKLAIKIFSPHVCKRFFQFYHGINLSKPYSKRPRNDQRLTESCTFMVEVLHELDQKPHQPDEQDRPECQHDQTATMNRFFIRTCCAFSLYLFRTSFGIDARYKTASVWLISLIFDTIPFSPLCLQWITGNIIPFDRQIRPEVIGITGTCTVHHPYQRKDWSQANENECKIHNNESKTGKNLDILCKSPSYSRFLRLTLLNVVCSSFQKLLYCCLDGYISNLLM